MRHEIEITKTNDETHTHRVVVTQFNEDGVSFVREANEFGARAFDFMSTKIGHVYEGATFTQAFDFGRARTLKGKILKALAQA